MPLARVLAAATLATLVLALALSLVAVRGFWAAPFGDVLRPLPIALAGFALGVAPDALGLGVPLSYRVVVGTGAVLAAFVAAAEGVVLLAGWRPV